MNTEAAFGDLGIDAITGTTLMGLLDMSPDEFSSPERFSKLRSVIDYLKQFPSDTQRFIITRATRGKYLDRLQHVFEYTSLLENKYRLEQTLEEVNKERSAIEAINDPAALLDITNKYQNLESDISRIQEEIAIYEK